MESCSKKIIIGVSVVVLVFIGLNLIQFIWPEQEYKLVPRSEAISPTAVKVTPSTDQHPPRLNDSLRGIWADSVPMPGPINTAGGEDSPYMMPDGKTFIFGFTPLVTNAAGESVNDGATGIYWTKYDGTAWSEPERVFLGWNVLDGCPTYFNDDLYYCSARGPKAPQMYRVHSNGTVWETPVLLKEVLGITTCLGELHETNGGNKIYHAAETGEGADMGLYSIEKVGDTWQAPVPLVGINSANWENMPHVTEDGQHLYFTRAPLTDGQVGPPEVY